MGRKELLMKQNYLQVGYARVDITPTESVPLAGFGNTSQRMSRAIRDELYASCFAITDAEDTTVILMSMDLQRGTQWEAAIVQEAALQQFGIPADHVFVAGTHTHAAPDQFNLDEPSIQRYRQLLSQQLPACMSLAMADRRPARMFVGDVEAEGMNFVRHYCHRTADGTVKYFGANYGEVVLDETTRHSTEADPTLHIVKFVREGGKDLVLVNWRAHGILCAGAQKYDVSADFMGGLRSVFEQRTNSLLTYFQGAAGNLHPSSRIRSEMRTNDCVAYSRILADYVFQGLQNLQEISYAPIRTKQRILQVPVNKPSEELLARAKEISAQWKQTNDLPLCKAAGQPYNIHSPYHAGAIIKRSNMEDIMAIELNAVTLGDLAFVTAPNELFDTNSAYVEANAPCAKVLTFGYCNNMLGYIPSQLAFDLGCYEADCCYFHPGIGEALQDSFLEMLSELKN